MNAISRLPVTFALISACVLFYVAASGISILGGSPWNAALVSQPNFVFMDGGLIPALVAQGELWRLFTSVFLHSGLIHLGVNMLSLYFLGSFTELTFGRGRFLALYLLSGLSGGVAYLYFGGFTTPAVGASGAIFGLLGGVFGYSIRQGTFSLQNPVIRQLLLLLALNVYIGLSVANVSNTAHMGGLAGGLAFGFLVAPTVYAQKKSRAAAPVLIVLGIEVLLVGTWLFLPG